MPEQLGPCDGDLAPIEVLLDAQKLGIWRKRRTEHRKNDYLQFKRSGR